MRTMMIEADGPEPVEPANLSSRRAETVGMWLFLAALTMLFFAAMLGYLLVRGRLAEKTGEVLEVPALLWLSTGLLIASGMAIEWARRLVQRERQRLFRRAVVASFVLSVLFVLVQTPALLALLQTHARMKVAGVGVYGLVFALILLHAAHIVGGLIPMIVTARKAMRGAYDHEHYAPVSRLAMYWHFLDAVWLVMFGVFVFVK